MVLMLIADPERVGSTDPQDIPDLNITVPIAVSDTNLSKSEWEKRIKQTDAPVLVKDIRSDDKLDMLTTTKEEEA